MTPIEKLEAMEEIRGVKARYFRFVDTKDWAGLHSIFSPDARLDFTYARTPIDAAGNVVALDGVTPPSPSPGAIYDRDGMVTLVQRTLGAAVSVHHGHMSEIEFTGPDTAHAIWSMEDMVAYPEGAPIRRMHGYGHYHEDYVRLADGWKIKFTRLTRLRVDELRADNLAKGMAPIAP